MYEIDRIFEDIAFRITRMEMVIGKTILLEYENEQLSREHVKYIQKLSEFELYVHSCLDYTDICENFEAFKYMFFSYTEVYD